MNMNTHLGTNISEGQSSSNGPWEGICYFPGEETPCRIRSAVGVFFTAKHVFSFGSWGVYLLDHRSDRGSTTSCADWLLSASYERVDS